MQPMGDHKEPVFAVGISPNGNTLFSGSGDGTVQLWDALSGNRVGELPARYEDMVLSLAISSDSKSIVTGTGDVFHTFGKARLWDVGTKEISGEFSHMGPVWAAAFSPDDKTVVTGSEKQALHWKLERLSGTSPGTSTA